MEQNGQLQPANALLNRNYRTYYYAFLVGFGILITILTALVTYKVTIMDIESELGRTIADEQNQEQEELTTSLKPLPTTNGTVIIFEQKQIKIQKAYRNAIIILVFIVFLLSLPLASIISRAPTRLSRKIMQQNKTLEEHFKLIDTNIPTCTIDRAGNLITASTFFIEKTGFEKQQLLAMHLKDLEDKNDPVSSCKQILEQLTAGKNWEGEIHFRTAEGGHLWTSSRAYPKYDDANTVVACSIIHRYITNQKKIEEISIRDNLTGLYNRRFFDETIARELRRAQRDYALISFAMLNVDYFKQYNDHYGHQKGEEVLKTISKTLTDKLTRASDFCFRLGGEDFGILFVDAQPETAATFVDGIRQAVQNLEIEHSESKIADVVTISIGLLTLYPDADFSVDTIYQKADEALCAAKKEGRNRLVSIDSTFPL